MQSRAELPVTVVAASGCAVPPEIVLGIRSEAERSPNGPVMPHAELYASVSFDLERPMDVGRFAEALASPLEGIEFRASYVLSIEPADPQSVGAQGPTPAPVHHPVAVDITGRNPVSMRKEP